ncbi:hypothetical protein F4680DRAFT_245873 [Xylaria scruposa]|nr:hypothetical protein F4680DRAFT_245873 [Xylaria scruposa]
MAHTMYPDWPQSDEDLVPLPLVDGCEALAVRCFGYVLLDEDHERALDERFGLSFDGDVDDFGGDEMRTRFLGKDGRAPPIRGIVKQFGRVEDEEKLRPAFFRKVLGDVRRLQKLGIMHLDVATRQVVDDRFSDFSTAITVPHFLTTPELNPGLTPDMRSVMEFQTFTWAMADYLEFDEMMFSWNNDYADQKGSISVRAFPGGMGCRHHYQLRSKAAQEYVFTFVDPRRYDWRRRPRAENKSRRLRRARPWFYDCRDDRTLTARLKRREPFDVRVVHWDYSDGFIFPRV